MCACEIASIQARESATSRQAQSGHSRIGLPAQSKSLRPSVLWWESEPQSGVSSAGLPDQARMRCVNPG